MVAGQVARVGADHYPSQPVSSLITGFQAAVENNPYMQVSTRFVNPISNVNNEVTNNNKLQQLTKHTTDQDSALAITSK